MFTKGSRFADLKRKLDKVKEKKEKLITILVLMIGLSWFCSGTTCSYSWRRSRTQS
jgi:hypothetical protein